MTFDEQIPMHIQSIERERNRLFREKLALSHNCGCDFCEYYGVPEENKEQYNQIEEEIEECNRTLSKLEEWQRFKRLGI